MNDDDSKAITSKSVVLILTIHVSECNYLLHPYSKVSGGVHSHKVLILMYGSRCLRGRMQSTVNTMFLQLLPMERKDQEELILACLELGELSIWLRLTTVFMARLVTAFLMSRSI